MSGSIDADGLCSECRSDYRTTSGCPTCEQRRRASCYGDPPEGSQTDLSAMVRSLTDRLAKAENRISHLEAQRPPKTGLHTRHFGEQMAQVDKRETVHLTDMGRRESDPQLRASRDPK